MRPPLRHRTFRPMAPWSVHSLLVCFAQLYSAPPKALPWARNYLPGTLPCNSTPKGALPDSVPLHHRSFVRQPSYHPGKLLPALRQRRLRPSTQFSPTAASSVDTIIATGNFVRWHNYDWGWRVRHGTIGTFPTMPPHSHDIPRN
jgi:hypothetical protein